MYAVEHNKRSRSTEHSQYSEHCIPSLEKGYGQRKFKNRDRNRGFL